MDGTFKCNSNTWILNLCLFFECIYNFGSHFIFDVFTVYLIIKLIKKKNQNKIPTTNNVFVCLHVMWLLTNIRELGTFKYAVKLYKHYSKLSGGLRVNILGQKGSVC